MKMRNIDGSIVDLNCPFCFNEHFVKGGRRYLRNIVEQQFLCRKCGRNFTHPVTPNGVPMEVIYENKGGGVLTNRTIVQYYSRYEEQPKTYRRS